MNTSYNTVTTETYPKITVLKKIPSRTLLMYLFYVLSFGVLYLLSNWIKSVEKYPFEEDDSGSHVLIEDEDGGYEFLFIETLTVSDSTFGFSSSNASKQIQTFLHRYVRYYRTFGAFTPVRFNESASSKSFHSLFERGLSDSDVEERRKIYGFCLIDVAVPSIPQLFAEGVVHPFFIFQVASCIVWQIEDYIYYAYAILVMSLVSLLVNMLQVRSSVKAVRNLAHYECQVQVFRGEWAEMSSKLLVPGDIVKVNEGIALPCDLALLKGFCLADESMLTGESQVVVKEYMPNSSSIYYTKQKAFSLFAGTVPKICKGECIGCVTATGFETAKGELVRSILFPKPNRFSFYADSFKFIGIMSILGFIGFFLSIVLLIELEESTRTVLIRSLDLITIVIPPILPMVLSIGTSFSIYRLKLLKISCISLPAVNAAGRVSVVVFDKTGTITEDGMRLKGVLYSEGGLKKTEDVPYEIQENLSTCNSLTYIRGMLQGDPQEIAAYESTGWDLMETEYRWAVAGPNGPVFVLQVFQFSSETKRMGVIIKNSEGIYLHMKGAPEVLLPLCNNKPEGLEAAIEKYTKEGGRLLACGYKKLEEFDPDAPLDLLEINIEYLATLVFENPLKPDSAETIRTLIRANIRSIISTGDALLTGIAVGKICSIIPIKFPLYIGEMQKNKLLWRDPTHKPGFLPKKCSIAITGEILEYMYKTEHPDLSKVISNGVVFGRMYPAHKILLINLLQTGDTMVAMVGDGANDCGALKAADVGLSLSQAEASIAAPFCSAELKSIISVLKEGRAALVTSLESFKFVALYSIIQFTCAGILYTFRNNLMEKQYMYHDFVIILPISVSMANTGPFHMLSETLPPGKLFSYTILGSILGHVSLVVVFQFATVSIVYFSGWSDQNGEGVSDPVESVENSALFTMACFQLLIGGIVFNIGPPYRKATVENFWFTGATTFILLMTLYLLLVPEVFGSIFGVVELSVEIKYIILALVTGMFGMAYTYEKNFMPKMNEKDEN